MQLDMLLKIVVSKVLLIADHVPHRTVPGEARATDLADMRFGHCRGQGASAHRLVLAILGQRRQIRLCQGLASSRAADNGARWRDVVGLELGVVGEQTQA